MKTQNVLDKFEDVFTTVDVFLKENGECFAFNIFDVVPVRCDIRFFLEEDFEVDGTFVVDRVTLDTSDDTITFELNGTVKEMIQPGSIISLNVSKISKTKYDEAIWMDKHRFDLFN